MTHKLDTWLFKCLMHNNELHLSETNKFSLNELYTWTLPNAQILLMLFFFPLSRYEKTEYF